jgi:hypothetical protein
MTALLRQHHSDMVWLFLETIFMSPVMKVQLLEINATTGSAINANFVSVSRPLNIAFASVPEPSTYALFGIGAIGMLMVMRRKKTA